MISNGHQMGRNWEKRAESVGAQVFDINIELNGLAEFYF
jgi:hypothetical protein